MPTDSVTSSITSTIRQLEASYGPQASAAAHGAAAAFSGWLPAVELISAAVSIAFIVGIVMIVIKTGYVRTRLERLDAVVMKNDHTKKHAKKTWGEVERHFFSGSENDLKIAIVKADTLLDEALRESGVKGMDMGERLRHLTQDDLPNIEHVWEAHRLRNRIAHDADLPLKRDLAERALTVYEDALEHLGALDKAAKTTSSNSQSN